MLDREITVSTQRDAAVRYVVHGRNAGAPRIAPFINYDFHINSPFFGCYQCLHNIRGGKRISHHPYRGFCGVNGAQDGTVAKLAMRQPFVLFKGLTFQKLCLPGAFRPGDHHNKMLRPGLCVVHASPQYL